MSKPTEVCQSFRDGGICADGFVQKPFCRGVAGCVSCGKIKESSLPYCLCDVIPMHMLNADGSPRFYTRPEKVTPQ